MDRAFIKTHSNNIKHICMGQAKAKSVFNLQIFKVSKISVPWEGDN